MQLKLLSLRTELNLMLFPWDLKKNRISDKRSKRKREYKQSEISQTLTYPCKWMDQGKVDLSQMIIGTIQN